MSVISTRWKPEYPPVDHDRTEGMVSPDRAMTLLFPPELDRPNALSTRSPTPPPPPPPPPVGRISMSGQSAGSMAVLPPGTPGVGLVAVVWAQSGMNVCGWLGSVL